jgi:hypothetical protein
MYLTDTGVAARPIATSRADRRRRSRDLIACTPARSGPTAMSVGVIGGKACARCLRRRKRPSSFTMTRP